MKNRNEIIKALCLVALSLPVSYALAWKNIIRTGGVWRRLRNQPLPRACWEALRDDDLYWILSQFIAGETSIIFPPREKDPVEEAFDTLLHGKPKEPEIFDLIRKAQKKYGCPDDINDVIIDRLRSNYFSSFPNRRS